MNKEYSIEEHAYLVTRGFLKRIKEAMEAGHYPDKERGEQLLKTLEQKIREFEVRWEPDTTD